MTSFQDVFNDVKIVVVNHKELEKNVDYNISHVEIKGTTYGDSALVTLERNNERVKIFMGKRYTRAFSESIVSKINSGEEIYSLQYQGVSSGSGFCMPLFVVKKVDQ